MVSLGLDGDVKNVTIQVKLGSSVANKQRN